jgi:hypothetical protein
MRYILLIIILFIFAVPAFPGQDSYKEVVDDYKLIEKLFASGEMNQVDHNKELRKLQFRVRLLQELDCFNGQKESDPVYCLSPPYCSDEDCLIILKIASGFKQEPS